ncbi:HK97 family phage prohead protease [Paenibacillus sp. FSL H7-0735]|uniref:HK97 family phage prohead protease n=1 Tax=Paenibacillus sp. FSL H7-0735 TaxID=2954736 RepID=UPI0030F5A9AF
MSKNNLPVLQGPERRAFAMDDLRADPAGNVIEGHAAVYDQETVIGGWFKEVIERGAFDRTDFKDVIMTVNHDLQRIPLARSRNNNANSTLQLQVDQEGLSTRAVLDVENNVEAKALYSAVSRGDLSGMSFIFLVRKGGEVWEGLDTELPTRRIKDIARVIEISTVSFPAYDGTDINARDQKALDSARTALESARSGLDSSMSELDLAKEKLKFI